MTTTETVVRPGKSAASLPAKARNRWWIVLASVLGLIAAQGPIVAFSSAVFLGPVTQALGISRGTFSSGLLLSTVLSALAGPVVGRLMDRWGVRPVLLWGIALFAAGTASMALLQASPIFDRESSALTTRMRYRMGLNPGWVEIVEFPSQRGAAQ